MILLVWDNIPTATICNSWNKIYTVREESEENKNLY